MPTPTLQKEVDKVCMEDDNCTSGHCINFVCKDEKVSVEKEIPALHRDIVVILMQQHNYIDFTARGWQDLCL